MFDHFADHVQLAIGRNRDVDHLQAGIREQLLVSRVDRADPCRSATSAAFSGRLEAIASGCIPPLDRRPIDNPP